MKRLDYRQGLPGIYFKILSQRVEEQINQKLTECLYNKNKAFVSCIWLLNKTCGKVQRHVGGTFEMSGVVCPED
jgi:hypothetical protein